MAEAGNVSEELAKILQEFGDQEREKVEAALKEAGKIAKKEVKERSPSGPNGYRNGWTVKTVKRGPVVDVIIHNKKHPGLTHLLENSHVIRNANGTYGRTSPGRGQVVHIKPAEEAGKKYLLDRLEKEL